MLFEAAVLLEDEELLVAGVAAGVEGYSGSVALQALVDAT